MSTWPGLAGPALLETLAVRSPAMRSYIHRLGNFVRWRRQPRQGCRSVGVFDVVPCCYFSDHFSGWTACIFGSQSLAAIGHMTHSPFKQAVSVLPRASKDLVAYQGPGETQSRLLKDLSQPLSSASRVLKLWPLKPHLYSLRHGRAPDDPLTGRRSPVDVQRRGRWAVTASWPRRGMEGSLLSKMTRVNPEVVAFGTASSCAGAWQRPSRRTSSSSIAPSQKQNELP